MSLISIAFEVPWQCPRCKRPLLVNGVTERMHCGGCQSVVETPPAFWQDVLFDALEYAIDWEEGKTMTMTVMNRWGNLSVFYGRLPVTCGPGCEVTVPQPALLQALRTSEAVHCESCNKPIGVRAAPDWFREAMHSRVVALVAEEQVVDSAAGGEDPASLRFHCFGCGAAVPLDGKERKIDCKFCQTALVIPDAIWLRLRPAPTLSRWYMLAS